MTLEDRLKSAALPQGIDFYHDARGHFVFSIYGMSGGLTSRQVVYLIDRGEREGTAPEYGRDLGAPSSGLVDIGNGWRSYCVELVPWSSDESIDRIESAARVLRPKAQSATEI